MSLEKYGLDKAFKEEEEDIKLRISGALKAAEGKLTLGTLAANWQGILILILLISFWFMYHRMDVAQRELATKNETFNRLGKIDQIDQTLKSVQEHQQEYTQTDALINQIEAARSQIRALDRKIELANQAKFQEEAKKLSVEELSKDFFNNLGYANQPVKGGQK